MTRKQPTMSFNSSYLRVPINPYSQQPSPSYERGLVATPNTEDEGSSARKFRVASAASGSSRPALSMNSPGSKRGIVSKSIGCKLTRPGLSSNSSPLDSFMDFYESIPDYQDVTHLSDREFADKMKVLRKKHREYVQDFDGRYCPREFEGCQGAASVYKNKTCKSVNKLELANEWLNKSCDSLSSLGRKSDLEYGMRTLEMDNHSKKAPSANVSPRKYVQYEKKNELEVNIMDSGSSLSIDSHMLKSKAAPAFVVEEQNKATAHHIQNCDSPLTSTGRSESCQGISNLFGAKQMSTNNYDCYTKENINESHHATAKKASLQSCALQSSETSELNVQDCNSHYGLTHHDALTYEDYYIPSSGWMQSDSDSMLGTMHHIPSTRPSTAIMSQSLPGSPVTKRSSNSSKPPSKKKTRRKRRVPQKSVTKPVPFNFVSGERQYTRSTPDLSGPCQSPSPKHFRARPIPRNLFSNYVYQRKRDDEFFRALKRKVRAEEMLRAASLPPSMEFRERLGRGSASSGSESRRCRPRPRSGCAEGCSDLMDMSASTSRSNLAALLRIQTARQRLEAEHRRLREEQSRRAEMRLRERLTRLTPAWRSIQYSTEEDLALRAAARREEERQRRLEHGVLMRHMLHRVHTIPTLFERQSAALCRSPLTARSPRRSFDLDAEDQSGSGCPALTDDEDAADVKVFVSEAAAVAVERGPRPSRSRARSSRPCSADAGSWKSPSSPDAHKRAVTAVCAALRSPDRASSRLRTYHRQLPHQLPHQPQHQSQHRVEFSEQSSRSRSHSQDLPEDTGVGAPGKPGKAHIE